MHLTSRIFLAFLLLYGSVLPAHAALLLLSPGGNDSGNCQSSPCKTLTYANSQSNSGDTIQLGDGTYTDGGDTNIQPKNNTTWKAQNRHGALIQTGYPTFESLFLLPNGAHDITVDGFVINGLGPSGGCPSEANGTSVPNPENRCLARALFSTYTPQVATNYNYNITFSNNIVHDTRQSAILVVGHNIILTGNEIYNVGLNEAIQAPDFRGHHGCYFSVYQGEISYNYFHDILGYACQIFASADNISVHDNLFIGNIMKNSSLGITTQGSGHTMVNNLSIRDGGLLDPVAYVIISDTTRFWNNTVIDRQVNASRPEADVTSNEFVNNIVCYTGSRPFDMTNPVQRNNTTSCPSGTFVNPSTDNYRLAAGIAGETGINSLDLDKNPRPAGVAWDRGAYEFGGTGPAPVATSLSFVQNPSTTPAGQVITPPVTVQVLDQNGMPMAVSGIAIGIAIQTNAGSPPGTLSGTATQTTNSSGLATFNNLSIDNPGNGYTLRASATLNSIAVHTDSDVFNIINSAAPPTTGPLIVHPSNGRYFQNTLTGKAVFLTGSHTWCTLSNYSMPWAPDSCTIDYPTYLSVLQSHNHNFIRMWGFAQDLGMEIYPYVRNGGGTASDGGQRLNFSQFNQAWFDRLRQRVIDAGARGMYVSFILFTQANYYGDSSAPSSWWWTYDWMNPANNVYGGTPINGNILHTFTLDGNTNKLAVQHAFVQKVVATLNDLDNVLYEIANEAPNDSLSWQEDMATTIRNTEGTTANPKRHPIGMTAFAGLLSDGSHAEYFVTDLFNSSADWIAPGGTGGYPEYRGDNAPTDPPTATGNKVVLVDSDHIGNDSGANLPFVVWINATRGNQYIMMDPDLPADNSAAAAREPARKAMGQARLWADSMPLAAMTPQSGLSSTQYCLAQAGVAYVAYQPSNAQFSVNLQPGTYTVEFWNETTQTLMTGSPLTTGGGTTTMPFTGPGAIRLLQQVALPPVAGGPGGIFAIPRALGAVSHVTPVNLQHPIMRKVLGWYRVSKPWDGGPYWYDLLNLPKGVLTNLTTPITTGWGSTTRQGGDGEMRFTGVDGQGVNLGQPAQLNFTGPFTVMAWARVTDATAVDQYIVGHGYSSLTQVAQWALGWDNTAGFLNCFTYDGTSSTQYGTIATTALASQVWTHVTCMYDGINWKIYLNGVLNASTAGGAPFVNSLDVTIGTLMNDSGSVETWNGGIDDVLFFDRPLTDVEIRDSYTLSRRGWPSVLKRQIEVMGLGALANQVTGARPGSMLPFLWKYGGKAR